MADSLDRRSNSITHQLPNNPSRLPVVLLSAEEMSRPYVCSRCFKRFPSLYALGGHQNAHRHERREERRLQRREKRLALNRYEPSPQPQHQLDDIGSTNLASPLATVLTHGAILVHPLSVNSVAAANVGGVSFPFSFPFPYKENQNINFPYTMINPVSTIPNPTLVQYYHLHDDQERSGNFPASTSTTTGAAAPTNTDHHQALINIEADDDQNASQEEDLDLTLRL